MTPPLVSVVIATYNAGRYLPETLESVVAQTYRRREIIVVDDGSTDGTAVLMRRFPADVQYVRRAHRGLAEARNTALRLARGDYIALIDADDLWLPDKLAVQVEVAARHPRSGLIACDGVRFGEGALPTRLLHGASARALDSSPDGEITGDFHRDFIAAVPIGCPAQVLIPRHVIEQIGPFANLLAQDYDYYLRIAQRLPVTLHRHSLVRYRSRRDSLSGPPEDRALAWPLMKVPVLKAHARRSSRSDRKLINRRIAGLIRAVARELYERSPRSGRLEASAAMATLLLTRPWPPTALPFLLALWTPIALRRPGARAYHALRLRRSA